MFILATCLYLVLLVDVYFVLFLIEQGLNSKYAAAVGLVALYVMTYIFTNIFIQFNGYL